MRFRPAAVAVLLTSLILTFGCGSDGAREAVSGGAPRRTGRLPDETGGSRDAAGVPTILPKAAPAPQAPTPETAADADRLPTGGVAESTAPSMIIRTGNAGIEVDTLEPAVQRVQQLITRLGGYIANTSMQGGHEQLRQTMLELKVPAARFDELTSALAPIGKLEYLNVNAEDVGEEFTDVTARVANARRLEDRLVELLATRTGKLQDVLAVERELARVRETIERYEGRLRYLKTRIALSTLSVTLHEPPPLLTDAPGRNVIGEAFVRAWRNFVAVIAALIASTGFLAPLAALVVLAVFLWRHYRKP